MKRINIILYFLCLFAVLPIVATARTMTYTLNFDPSDFTIKKINGDTSVITSSKYDIYSNYDPTQPELPVIYVTFLLPPDMAYDSFTYTKTETEFADSVILKKGNIPASTKNYTSETNVGWYVLQDYPSKVQYIQSTIEGNYRMMSFKVMPFGYNAITKKVYIANFTLNIQTVSAETEDPNMSIRGIEERNYVQKQIWNKDDLQTLYPSQTIQRSYVQPKNGVVLKNRYIIITNDSLASAFQPLLEWKRLKGLDAEIKTISTIPKWAGYSTAKNIKRYLKDCYDNHPKKDSINFYVLLGGDVNIVPTVNCHIHELFPLLIEDVPCDMYYACVSGSNWTWDSNNNGIIGETSDVFSWTNDLYVSRASVNTIEQTNVFVNKVLQYEMNPPVETNWGDTILCLGGISHYKYDSNYTLLEEDSKVISDSICSQEVKPYWNGERKKLFVTENNLNYGLDFDNSYINKYRTAEQLSKNYSFVFEMSHGGHTEWIYRKQINSSSCIDGNIIDSIIAKNITSLYPKIILTSACETNEFDIDFTDYNESYPCLSEIMMRNPESGVVAYIGSSRNGYNEDSLQAYENLKLYRNYHNSNRFNRDFIRAMYNTSIPQTLIEGKHLGQIVNYGKKDLNSSNIIERYLRFTINTLGDPEMPVYTNCPQEFELTYEPHITDDGVLDNSQIYVNVGQTDFYVYVEKDNKLYRYMIGNGFSFEMDCDSTEFVIMKEGFVPKRVKMYSTLYLQNKTYNTNTNYSNYSRIFVGRDVYNDAVGCILNEDGDVIVTSGAKLSLKAKNQIQIKNGFKVESGGVFEMDIDN